MRAAREFFSRFFLDAPDHSVACPPFLGQRETAWGAKRFGRPFPGMRSFAGPPEHSRVGGWATAADAWVGRQPRANRSLKPSMVPALIQPVAMVLLCSWLTWPRWMCDSPAGKIKSLPFSAFSWCSCQ